MLCAVISYTTSKSPSIDADVLTLNPKSGDISANTDPDFNIAVSNAKLAILIFLNPLPSPTYLLPD